MLAPPRSSIRNAIGVSDAEEMKALSRNHHKDRSKKKKKLKMNYADLLNMTVLKKIRKEFVKRGGKDESLPAEEFCDVLSEYIPRPDVESIYKKIDVNDDGMVDWEEFTGFLISAEGGGAPDGQCGNSVQQYVLQREQECEPQTHSSQQHSGMIEHIAHGRYPFPMLATAAKDGKVLLWNPKTLQYINSIDHRDKSSVFLDSVTKSMPRADIARMQSRGANFVVKKNLSYFTALAILPVTGHICVSSADCCVNVYDSPSLELTGRLNLSTDIPTSMQAFAIMDKIRCINTQYLAIGNSKGKIVVITLNSSFAVATDGPLPKKQNKEIWETAVRNKYKWKIHTDWVTQMMYIGEINRLVSCSLDGTIVLSTIDTQPSARVFSGHDTGVRCFGWSNASKIICSAGTDRTVLIWDPFTLQVAHRIDNLLSMIISIQINDLSQQIVVVLEDKIIKTWDSLTYEPLNSSVDPSVQLPRNQITATLWENNTGVLYTAGNRVCSFRNTYVNKETCGDEEDDDLCKVLYNKNFYEVITITNGGFVNVFYVGDGSSDSKFQVTNSMQQTGNAESTLKITDAILDKVQRRLIVATNDNNEIQIWNFHSGFCLKSIRPRITHSLSQYPNIFSSDKMSYNITCLHYEHSVLGNQKTNKRMLMFGTDVGVVSVLIELPDDISEEPFFNFVGQTHGDKSEEKIRLPATAEDNDKLAPAPMAAGVDNTHATSSSTYHHPAKKNLVHKTAKSNDVLWVSEGYTNNVLVAYGDGTVMDWNIEKGVRNVTIKPSENLNGVSFVAFRRKFATSDARSETIAVTSSEQSGGKLKVDPDNKNPSAESTAAARTAAAAKTVTTTAAGAGATGGVLALTEDELRAMADPAQATQNMVESVMLAQTHTQSDQNEHISNNAVIPPSPIRKQPSQKKMLQPKVRANGPRRVTTGETARTLLISYGNHYEKQVAVAESGQESWQTTASHNHTTAGAGGGGIGGFFKAAIIGVAKKSHSDFPSLNPLLPEILSPRFESESEPPHHPSAKIAFSNYGGRRPVPMPARPSSGSNHGSKRRFAASGDDESKDVFAEAFENKISAWGEDPVNDTFSAKKSDAKSLPQHMTQPPAHKHNNTSNRRNKINNAVSNCDDERGDHERQKQESSLKTSLASQPDMASALYKVMPPSTPLTHSIHAKDKVSFRDSYLIGSRVKTTERGNCSVLHEAATKQHVGVICMVTLKAARIAIGACTDSLFRFWDLNSVKVLCSCSVGLELKTVKSGGAGGAPSTVNDMQLSCLTISADEDLLIGGYENGEIRIWIISMPSINNIRLTQKETMSGMSVPPIQLLNEWTGHESSVRSVEVVSLDGENWGDHELYLVSSGQDQGVHLWTISGEHIGSFGTHQNWDLLETSTWKVSQRMQDDGISWSSAIPTAPLSRSKPSFWRKSAHTSTNHYRIDPADAETNHGRMARLNRHMEKVKIKNQNKLTDPSTTEIHVGMITESQLRNPMTEVWGDSALPSSSSTRRTKSPSRLTTMTNNTNMSYATGTSANNRVKFA